MKQFLTSTNEQDIINAEQQIASNAGIPNAEGTTKWSDINVDLDETYYISSPCSGWGGYSCEQLMVGVSGVTEKDKEELNLPEEELI